MPGWPELAFCTASMARVRMVLDGQRVQVSAFSQARRGTCQPCSCLLGSGSVASHGSMGQPARCATSSSAGFGLTATGWPTERSRAMSVLVIGVGPAIGGIGAPPVHELGRDPGLLVAVRNGAVQATGVASPPRPHTTRRHSRRTRSRSQSARTTGSNAADKTTTRSPSARCSDKAAEARPVQAGDHHLFCETLHQRLDLADRPALSRPQALFSAISSLTFTSRAL